MLDTTPPFAQLFAAPGRPAEDPARFALILVWQFLEGVSDRQAADAVRSHIDWKYALACAFTDSGFDASVVRALRPHLRAGQHAHLLRETLLSQLHARALRKARGRQRTHSTHVLASIRTLNRRALVMETMHDALNRLAVVAPEWLRHHSEPRWLERSQIRAENSRFPPANTERHALAIQVGTDGFALLVAIDTPDTPAIVRAEPAVEVLRRVWIQHYDGPDDGPRWRSTADAPPPDDLMHAPSDLDARDRSKRGMRWTGDTVHLTETCDTTAPHSITQVETTPATRPDDHMGAVMHAALEHTHLLPAEHLVDGGYTDATTLIASPQRYGVTMVGRVAADPRWQAREQPGSAQAAFQIDWNAQKATCPQGKPRRTWFKDNEVNGQAGVHMRFSQQEGHQCPVRAAWTRAKTPPRTRTIRTQSPYEALQRARQQQDTPAFQARSAARGGGEATISQGTRAVGLRRTR